MNEGERTALMQQVKVHVGATERRLAGIGLPVRVVLVSPETGCVLSQDDIVRMAEGH